MELGTQSLGMIGSFKSEEREKCNKCKLLK